MNTQTTTQRHAPKPKDGARPMPMPQSAELRQDLERLERAEREKIDRQRQAELARRRPVQDRD